MAFNNSEPIQIKCISQHGELLRISTYEFFKKVMSQKKVAEMIFQSTKEKILKYILKSASRFNSIKQFNLPHKVNYKQQLPRTVKQADLNEKFDSLGSARSPSLHPHNQSNEDQEVQDFNKLILTRMCDKRDIMKEIVMDYPITKKTIQLDEHQARICCIVNSPKSV